MNKKNLITAVMLMTMVGSSLIAARPTYAADGMFSGLVEFISQKFNLDKNEVQTAVIGYHQERMQNQLNSRLDELVSQGKISNEQKEAVRTEMTALHEKYPFNSGEAAFEERHNEFKTWAEENGIDPTILSMARMGRGGRWNVKS